VVEHDDPGGMFDLMRHQRAEPTTAILRHYWLGMDCEYDVKRATEDFASANRRALRRAATSTAGETHGRGDETIIGMFADYQVLICSFASQGDRRYHASAIPGGSPE
jgi:hypothetical protein